MATLAYDVATLLSSGNLAIPKPTSPDHLSKGVLLGLGMGGGQGLGQRAGGSSLLILFSLRGKEGPPQTLPLPATRGWGTNSISKVWGWGGGGSVLIVGGGVMLPAPICTLSSLHLPDLEGALALGECRSGRS